MNTVEKWALGGVLAIVFTLSALSGVHSMSSGSLGAIFSRTDFVRPIVSGNISDSPRNTTSNPNLKTRQIAPLHVIHAPSVTVRPQRENERGEFEETE